MSDELKPVNCGCGGEAEVDTKLVSCAPVERKRVYCSKCYISTEWMKSEAEAITAWNRAMGIAEKSSTVERTAKVKNIAHVRGYPPEGECGNCGFDVIDDGEYCPGCGCRLDWNGNDIYKSN